MQKRDLFFKLPAPIDSYNQYMGSVDQADQLLKPYSSGRKSLAWFKKLGLHFIDRMLLNAFIIYKNQHTEAYKKKRLLDFIKEVSTELLMK